MGSQVLTKSCTKFSKGRSLNHIFLSNLDIKSACISLSIPFNMTCHHYKYKSIPLMNKQVNRKSNSERQNNTGH